MIKSLLTHLDNKIRNVNEIVNTFGMPLIGITPMMVSSDVCEHSFISIRRPWSPLAKSFQILYDNLLRANGNSVPQSVVITSSMASEGKSSTCINLATVFAQKGHRVLLVDADLRRPTAHTRFGLCNLVGLADYLAGRAEMGEITQNSFIPNLSVVTAGSVILHPGDLLARGYLPKLLKLATKEFDTVILDAPPTMHMSDALVLCSHGQLCLMLVAYGQSKKNHVFEALRRLRHSNARVAGVVLTKFKASRKLGSKLMNPDAKKIPEQPSEDEMVLNS